MSWLNLYRTRELKAPSSRFLKQCAFTLAEVLITLGIIGIVAEMTIPTLMNNAQVQQSKAGLKNAFSILNQAALLIENDNNGTLKNICSDADNACVRDAFANQLKWTKKCDAGAVDNVCWPAGWVRLNRDAGWTTSATATGLLLNNGTSLMFGNWDDYKAGCDSLVGGGAGGATMLECTAISIDINGLKKPNKVGQDIFFMHVLENNIKPYGSPTDWVSIGYAANGLTNYYMCDPRGDGEICSFDYLYK